MNKKVIFYIIYIALLSLIPITILSQVNLLATLKLHAPTANLIQRFLGLTLFTLMFWQIMLGAYMQKWTELLGGWVFRFHIYEGVVIYSLAILHPLAFVAFNYFSGRGFDPFYVYTQICFFCTTQEIYYTLGRISFWLLTVTVFAGLYRVSTPFMRVHWRKFHVFNYVIFLVIGIHGLSIGQDFMALPFFAFAVIAYLIVLYTIVRKLPQLFNTLKLWFKSD